jgi:hypothetical protein
MSQNNFNLDEKKARLAEEEVAKLFEKKYYYKTISFNRDKRYDFKCLIENKPKTVEVKSDWFCFPGKMVEYKFGNFTVEKYEEGRDSGNLFIEFGGRGKPTGIKTTEANYYVYYYTYFKKLWIINTKKLKKLIADNNFEIKDRNVGDKGSKTMGYVIPRDEFIEHFRVVDIDFEWPY